MDFDPRDYDSRDDERLGDHRKRGGRGDRDDDDLRLPDVRIRDHDDEGRELGRGCGDASRQSKECESGSWTSGSGLLPACSRARR
jgi:hypothetical protein